jgi:hypothetical protein
MQKVTGIKSVDFKITASGYGVVNWNGATPLMGDNNKTVDNHTLPKLRGYTNLNGEVKVKENGGLYKYKKEPSDINFKENPLYISQNCIRHHLFRDQAFDMHHAGEKDLLKVLASQTGLIRGYVVPSSQCKRTSPLLLEDFVDHLYNGNFEQFGQAGARDSSSFFSKTTFGDTEYLAYGSISIEQLQFISLDKKFDRCAMIVKEGDGEKVAKSIVEYLHTLDDTKKPEAVFHANYVRKGTIFEEGENGILLNQDAIQILVDYTLEIIRDLVIRQAKGYMSVDDVLVDFNESNKMMRIKRRPNEISEVPTEPYAIYFEAK